MTLRPSCRLERFPHDLVTHTWTQFQEGTEVWSLFPFSCFWTSRTSCLSVKFYRYATDYCNANVAGPYVHSEALILHYLSTDKSYSLLLIQRSGLPGSKMLGFPPKSYQKFEKSSLKLQRFVFIPVRVRRLDSHLLFSMFSQCSRKSSSGCYFSKRMSLKSDSSCSFLRKVLKSLDKDRRLSISVADCHSLLS